MSASVTHGTTDNDARVGEGRSLACIAVVNRTRQYIAPILFGLLLPFPGTSEKLI